MAAGISIVDICNIGLIELGENPIASLNDNRKAAILCKGRFDQARREMLDRHPWNFAKRQQRLSAATAAPQFDYANLFTLPADFVRLLSLPDCPHARYEVTADGLMSDEQAPLSIWYVADISDPTKFSPTFAKALGYYMGELLAMPITQDKAKRQQCYNLVEATLATGRLVNAQSNSPKEWDDDVLLAVRNS